MPSPNKFPSNLNTAIHETPETETRALRKRVKELERDVDHYEKLIGRLARLLTDTAKALSPDDARRDWSNLPDQAEDLRLAFEYKEDK